MGQKIHGGFAQGLPVLQSALHFALPAAEALDGNCLQPQQGIRQMGLVAGQVLFDEKAHEGKPLIHAPDVGGGGGGAVFQQRLRSFHR